MYAVTNPNNKNQNFGARLTIAKDIRLPKGKFEDVQRRFEGVTKEHLRNIPDVHIDSHYVERDDGSTFRCADIIIGDDKHFTKGSESVSMERFQAMFKELPVNKIRKIFIDLAKRAKLMTLKFELEWELSRLKPKIAGVRRQAEESAKLGHTIHARRFNNFADRLEQRAYDLEKQLGETDEKLGSIEISPYFKGWIS